MKKEIEINVNFKARLEMFILKWKTIRKFPDYSLSKEIKGLFTSRKLKCLYG